MHILRSHHRAILLIPITLLAWNATGCSDTPEPGGSDSGTDTEAVDSMDPDTLDPDSGGSDSGEPDSGGSDSNGDSGEPADTDGPDEDPALTYEVRCTDIGLTAESAGQIDDEGAPLEWTIAHDAEANALTLTRAGSCGQDCEFVDELVFINVNGPTGSVCEEVELLHASRRIADELKGALETEYDEYGITLIQDWNFDALISGTVAFSEFPGALQFRFYLDPTP